MSHDPLAPYVRNPVAIPALTPIVGLPRTSLIDNNKNSFILLIFIKLLLTLESKQLCLAEQLEHHFWPKMISEERWQILSQIDKIVSWLRISFADHLNLIEVIDWSHLPQPQNDIILIVLWLVKTRLFDWCWTQPTDWQTSTGQCWVTVAKVHSFFEPF